MRAGDFDRQIDLLTVTKTQNGFGEETVTTTVLATVAAQKQSLKVADMQLVMLHADQADAKFIIRWRDDVTNDMMIAYEGQNFSIIGTEEIGRRRGLTLTVRVG